MRSSSGFRAGELLRLPPVGDEEFRLAALEPVGDVGFEELRHRRDEHQAELHRGEHRDPQLWRHAEHHQEPVAPLRADRAQAVGELRRLLREFGEGPRLYRLADHLQRDVLPVVAGRQFGVEPVERPVESLGRGQTKVVVAATYRSPSRQQEIARRAERRRRGASELLREDGGHGVEDVGHGGDSKQLPQR